MPRVKRGVTARARHKKVLALAKGFRGREITHQDLGMALLNRIRDELGDLILVEQFPKLEGRQMIMMIAPGRKKIAPAKAAPAESSATV